MHFFSLRRTSRARYDDGPNEHKFHLLPRSSSTSTESLPLRICDMCKEAPVPRSRTRSWLAIIFTLLNLALFGVSAFVFISNLRSIHTRNALLKQTSFYSPILDRLDIPLHTTAANGSLFAGDPPSIFRQPPSDEVDAAWERITKIPPFMISSDVVRKLGKDPVTAVRVPLEWNLGPNMHLAEINGQHLLHCLNSLRKAAYYEHYERPLFGDSPGSLYWTHLSHCIDMLRQSLTCTANVDIITFNWIADQDHPFHDFNVQQVCRDHEAVLKWQEDNKLDTEAHPLITIPEGVVPLAQSHRYYEMFGIPDPNEDYKPSDEEATALT